MFFLQVTNISGENLQKADEIEIELVQNFGFSKGLALGFVKGIRASEGTRRRIEIQVSNIIEDCEKRTLKLLTDKKQSLLEQSSKLIDMNLFEHADIKRILGNMPEEPYMQD